MKNKIAYIKERGQLIQADTRKDFCGYYAGHQMNPANGWNDRNTNAGDLFAVMCQTKKPTPAKQKKVINPIKKRRQNNGNQRNY